MLFSEKNIISVIRWGVIAALFLPLIIIPWLFFPFATSRGFLFQIIVEVLAVLYIPLAICNPSFRPNKTALLSVLSMYFGALLLSTVFGIDTYRSFFGNYERMWGFFQLAHFFVFFIILAGVFRTREAWGSLLRGVLVAGGLSALAALLQYIWSLSSGDAPRPSGLIGNPAFLAAYLLFTAFASILHFQRGKYGYGVLATLVFVAILFTGTRGAFVGLAAAGVVGAVLLTVFSRTRWLRILSALCVGLVIAGMFFLVQYGSFFEKPERVSQETFYSVEHFDSPSLDRSGFGFLSRLVDFSIYDTTTLTRLATWKTVLASSKDYPVFGMGPENFILAFNKYFNSEFYTAERSEIWFDRAHNAYIDTLVMYGFLGLVTYLLVYAGCFWVIFRLYRSGTLAPLSAFALSLFFVAYGTQNFFLFDSFSAFLMFIFAIAYLNSFLRGEEERKLSVVPARFFMVPTLFALALIYFFTVRPLAESYLLAKAESGVFGIDRSMAIFDQALSWQTFGDNEVRSRLALAVAKEVQGTETEVLPQNLSQYLDASIAALDQNIQQSNKYHLLYRLQLSDVYNLKLSRTSMSSEEIENIVSESIAISPGRMEFEFALAQTELLKENYKQAIMLLENASLKNPEHPTPYWKIAQNYHFLGNDDKAIPYAEKAFWLGYNIRTYKELQWVIEYYTEKLNNYPTKENFAKLVFFNKIIAKHEPTLVWPQMNLAIAYANLGQKDKAKEFALKVGELDPAQQEAVSNFLKALE